MNSHTPVSCDDLAKDIAHYQDIATVRPVYVGRNGRAETVMISLEEYERLQRRDRQSFAAGELPATILHAIDRSVMDSRHDHLDQLLEDGSV